MSNQSYSTADCFLWAGNCEGCDVTPKTMSKVVGEVNFVCYDYSAV